MNRIRLIWLALTVPLKPKAIRSQARFDARCMTYRDKAGELIAAVATSTRTYRMEYQDELAEIEEDEQWQR